MRRKSFLLKCFLQDHQISVFKPPTSNTNKYLVLKSLRSLLKQFFVVRVKGLMKETRGEQG